jgi:ABC-type transport system involved in cytochrome c biogenesis permease subunit
MTPLAVIVPSMTRSIEIPLLGLAAVDLAASIAVGWFRPRAGRFLLLAGFAALAAALVVRGIAIGYLPLTQRPESIAGFVLCAIGVALFTERRVPENPTVDVRLYRLLLLLPPLALLTWSIAAWPTPQHPVSLLVTVWYCIHVPLSFIAYGIWSAAFAGAIVRLAAPLGPEETMAWDARIRSWIVWGFHIFSISMVTGGIWGYLAWGYVFLWDPKMELSVALWLAYAALAHLTALEPRPRLRAILAIPAWVVMWLAYLGVAFFRTSIHGFG